MKKTALIIAAIILISIAGVFYYLKKQRIPDFDVLKIIPNDIAFFIDVKDSKNFLEKLTHKNAIWEELKNIKGINKFDKQLYQLDSIVSKDKTLQNHFSEKRIIIAGKKQGKSKLNFLYMMEIENHREQNHLKNYLTKWAAQKNHQTSSRTYNNTKLYNIQIDRNKSFTYGFIKGTLVASKSSILVEKAVRSVSVKKSIKDEESFQRIHKTAGKNVIGNLYLNYTELPKLIKIIFNNNLKEQASSLVNFAKWSALDINVKKEALLINGFTGGTSGKKEMTDIFSNQAPVEQEIPSILPANTSAYATLGISDKDLYKKDYKEFLKQTGEMDTYNKNNQKINTKYGFDPESTLYNILDEELGITFLGGNAEHPQKKAFIILKTKSKRFARKKMEPISRKACSESGISEYKEEMKIDKETKYEAFKLPAEYLFEDIFGDLFKGISNQYFTFVDNFVVFSSSPKMLEKFIHSNILNKTLDNDHQYQQFTDYISEKSNFHFYSNMFRSPRLIGSYFKENIDKGIQENIEQIRKFQAIAYQITGNGDMTYNNIFIKYIPTIDKDPQTTWECHLDTTINMKPALVTNHYTGENEIFIQDNKNKIYLINKVGRILWEKQLSEKIISEIHQVDYYRNGKKQMLFNTKNKIHLIDRNGNYVERYPVNLPSPAVTELSVFDYSDNKKYRVFVPCENRKVYNYNIEGNSVEGWQFGKTDTKVTSPVQHFRVKTKDYIVLADQNRVYILNRRGNVRVKPENQIAKSKNNRFYLNHGDTIQDANLVTTDKNGKVHHFYFDGEVKSVNYNEYSEEHFFLHEDINSDGAKEMIFSDNKQLDVFEESGEKLFDQEFKNSIDHEPIYFHFSYNERKIGVVSKKANKIYLLNSNGEIYKGFPLEGNTPFSIGFLEKSSRKFNLVVGNKYNFLYNYSVN
ncbi:MAG: DUF3352 domain-containing protein [Bacteroidota bacterium]